MFPIDEKLQFLYSKIFVTEKIVTKIKKKYLEKKVLKN